MIVATVLVHAMCARSAQNGHCDSATLQDYGRPIYTRPSIDVADLFPCTIPAGCSKYHFGCDVRYWSVIEAHGQIVNLPLAASSTQPLYHAYSCSTHVSLVPRQSQHVCSAELFLYFDIMKHDVMLSNFPWVCLISCYGVFASLCSSSLLGYRLPCEAGSIGTCKNRKSAWHGDCGPDVDILAVTRGMSHDCDPVLLVPQWLVFISCFRGMHVSQLSMGFAQGTRAIRAEAHPRRLRPSN